jgi:hypothetical protein
VKTAIQDVAHVFANVGLKAARIGRQAVQTMEAEEGSQETRFCQKHQNVPSVSEYTLV